MTTIEDLYNHFSVLADAKDKASEHEAEYKSIVEAVMSVSSNEKRLASQFTARFFKFFPHLAEESLQALFSLCQDADATIRKQVIKDLGTVCRDSPQFTERVAHVVTNLIQTADTTELSLVHMSLVSLLKAEPKGAMAGIFANILLDEGVVRDRAINFLSVKVKLLLAEDLLTKDVEEIFMQHCRKVLEDVTGEEFKVFMKILTSLPSMGTVQGRQNLLDIIVTEADFKSKFEPQSEECLDRFSLCTIEALPLFSKNVHSAKFVEYICLSVLPVFRQIGSPANSDEQNKEYRMNLLKQLAEMSPHCGDLEKTEECVANVYSCLIEFMPPPDSELPANELPNVEYIIVECLMYTFHQLARRCPQWLTDKDNAERLKDFRQRLQCLAGTVKVNLKYVKGRLENKASELTPIEKEQFLLTVESTNNLNALIKDLFYNPPAYKAVVALSFKKSIQGVNKSNTKLSTSPATGVKRPSFTPVKFDSGEPPKKLTKTEQKIYAPPGGKFSEKAGNYPAQQGSTQRGRRGGFKRW